MLRQTPQRIRRLGNSLQMLSRQAQREVLRCEHTVICLMVLVAICSIVWSIPLHILSADFSEGFISAKIIYMQRDFTQMDNVSKEIFYADLAKVTQRAYSTEEPAEQAKPQLAGAFLAANELQPSESQTKPKVYKIEHVYVSKEDAPVMALMLSQRNATQATPTTDSTTTAPKIVHNPAADRQFLASMAIDARATHWSRGASAQFVFAFPFISEIVAIIWTAMCFIFQTGSKKTWGLPKPWRIVVPSMFIFTLMSLGSISYTILTNGILQQFCTDLRANLTNPAAISCGDAMALLRPAIYEHRISHDAHLELFRFSYTLSMLLWIVALLVMVLRFVFAVDFQLVDIEDMYERKPLEAQYIQPIYTAVLQQSPQHRAQPQAQARPRSEDDFQSAKSRLSDIALPLIETLPAEQSRQQCYLPTMTKA